MVLSLSSVVLNINKEVFYFYLSQMLTSVYELCASSNGLD